MIDTHLASLSVDMCLCMSVCWYVSVYVCLLICVCVWRALRLFISSLCMYVSLCKSTCQSVGQSLSMFRRGRGGYEADGPYQSTRCQGKGCQDSRRTIYRLYVKGVKLQPNFLAKCNTLHSRVLHSSVCPCVCVCVCVLVCACARA